jgi:16S rRNA U516 pseudouridylate synthase RsuA-like enzyme
MQQIDEFLAQCEHLQRHEIEELIRAPNMAVERSIARREIAYQRYSKMSAKEKHAFCR